MSQLPNPSTAHVPPPPNDPGLGDDPLAKLHRMSTTAGVASQQYVAINGAAVVATVLAAVSLWFGLMAWTSTLWLVIPLAGVICGIVAWRQIADSNGTEKGRLFAAIGVVGSLLIAGAVIARQAAQSRHERADGRAMADAVAKLGDLVRANKMADAYQMFSVNFRTRISEDVFAKKWTAFQDPAYYGKLQSLTWNDVPPQYEQTDGGETTLAVIYAAGKFERAEPRFTVIYRKAGDTWQLDNIPEVFPAERKQPSR